MVVDVSEACPRNIFQFPTTGDHDKRIVSARAALANGKDNNGIEG